jgi:hypothetical protein
MRLLDRWQAYTKLDRAIIELRSALDVESRTSPQRQDDGRNLKAHRLAGSQTAGVHEREVGPVKVVSAAPPKTDDDLNRPRRIGLSPCDV